MKIIGHGDGNRHIIEASFEEVARLCGFSSTYSGDWRAFGGGLFQRADDPHRLRIGAEVPISAWWDRLDAIRRREEELAKLGETLKSLAALIEGSWPKITAALPQAEGEQS